MTATAHSSTPSCLPPTLKPQPPAVKKPTFVETTTDIRLLRDASLVQDVISLAKFCSTLKVAARQRATRQQPRFQQPEMLARIFPAHSQPTTPVSSQLLSSLRGRVRKFRGGPSCSCARMPTISEEFDANVEARGDVTGSHGEQSLVPAVITGPLLKRRGGMSALTSLVEEEEGDEYGSDSWEGEELESPTSSFASDNSCEAPFSPHPNQTSHRICKHASPIATAWSAQSLPLSDEHCSRSLGRLRKTPAGNCSRAGYFTII
ncbi:hypothetical protein K488DRAFT_74479 [Vararia minispora EC-137]|uniref:Uncharacterized protein n=1 Tax=Vararia minispora EC-137 TaxID=1314806 RepID=A0ACB8Q7C3_9AGAM|nr:hypothetical protein K488DRAFT_74479 [Vararia minispora EC-137]